MEHDAYHLSIQDQTITLVRVFLFNLDVPSLYNQLHTHELSISRSALAWKQALGM